MNPRLQRFAVLGMLLCVGGLVSCRSGRLPSGDRAVVAHPVMASGYVLSLNVMVAGEKEIDVKGRRIRENGTVEVPLLGAVKAQGMTLREFTEYLQGEYGRRFFVDPTVSVDFDLTDEDGMFPWGYVTVLGRVSKPGKIRIPATRDLSLTQAIQESGGLIKYARRTGIRISRGSPDGEGTQTITVNLRSIEADGKGDLILKHGDVVHVPEVVF